MPLIQLSELKNAVFPPGLPGSETLAIILMKALKLHRINEAYDELIESEKIGRDGLEMLLNHFGAEYEFDPQDLKHIPKSGPFITLSNHPFGAIDGMMLAHLISQVRPDYKLMANFLLSKILPISSFFLPVNPFEDKKTAFSSLTGIKGALHHLREGHPLGIFPAGEVSAFQFKSLRIEDKPWPDGITKLIRSAAVPVIPVFFNGRNSRLFYLMGLIHPRLRTIKLPSELLNKKGNPITVRIGKSITPEDFSTESLTEFKSILRSKVYSLSYREVINSNTPHNLVDYSNIISPVPEAAIKAEIETLGNYFLFQVKDYSVYCCPSSLIPNTMTEIARSREITYREVGEGTGKPFDRDKFDDYYYHLFIWDKSGGKLVGSYRIGLGRHILEIHGLKGFYIHTLFKINKKLEPLLNDSLELGRSFIVKEYQKKATPLFLLWKALFVLLVKYDYRYLIGPVSISGYYSAEAKSLAANFLWHNYANKTYARYIKNRNKTDLSFPSRINQYAFYTTVGKDFNKLDAFISDIDSGYNTPVLVKQYVSLLRTTVLGFNVDPDFNNCLDALMVMDIKNAPRSFMEMLSKDLKDYSKIETLLNGLV